MAVYRKKGSKIYWYSFIYRGERIQESTKQSNKTVARQIQDARKTQLAKDEVGIKDRERVPTLAQFAESRFLPNIQVRKKDKPRTVAFYTQRCARLIEGIGKVKLDQIGEKTLTAYIEARRKAESATSTINRDLATLRKLLRFAVREGVIQKAYEIKLLPGEASRERVLTHDEERTYLLPASPLLHDIAVIMLDCGLRPDEVHRLRWDSNIKPGAIEVHTGKTDGARRTIPTTPRVEDLLAGLPRPSEWVFPAPTKSGHITADTYKKHHAKAMAGLPDFVPYSLRHTCITRWAKAGATVPTLKYLAGHKNIATTMKYIHLAGTDAGAELA